MNVQRILKKALLLVVGYIFFIFGIFIIQFKNGSSINERFGEMRVSLATNNSQGQTETLQNNLKISFNGISFVANDDTPILATAVESGEKIPLKLESWQKINDLACSFNFSENVRLVFSLSDVSENAWLDIRAGFPENIESISLPYTISSGYAAEQQNNSALLVSGKNANWTFSAQEIDGKKFSLSPNYASASYRHMRQSELFTFADIPESDLTSAETYNASLEAFKNALVSSYQSAFRNNATVTEHEIVAFVAAMAESGRYAQALESVPQSFRSGNGRTYFSAPYFNSLINMNRTLTTWLNSMANLVRERNDEPPLEILTTEELANYVNIYRNSSDVANFVQRLAESVETLAAEDNLLLSDAINVLRFYNELAMAQVPLATQLENAAGLSVQKIESFATLEDEMIIIAEGGSIIAAIDTARIADALIQYGKHTNFSNYTRAGYLMLNALFANVASFERQTLAALYPIVVHDNLWYPHVMVFDENSTNPVWAWTCAQNIRYMRTTNSTRIEVVFPETLTHHVIFRGVEEFSQILIYETQYRSDPRFESYNASGYIYQPETQSFLLKSRHRSQTETVVMTKNPSSLTLATPNSTETSVSLD